MFIGARDQIRTGIPFEVYDLSYSLLANRSHSQPTGYSPPSVGNALDRKGQHKTNIKPTYEKRPPLFEGRAFCVDGARDQIRTGIPFEVYDLSYSRPNGRSPPRWLPKSVRLQTKIQRRAPDTKRARPTS